MLSHNKKARQRNRPRNKVNRLKVHNVSTEQVLSSTTIIPPTKDNDVSKESSLELNGKLLAEVPTRSDVDDSTEAIKVIQKLLRAKLLKQTPKQSDKSITTDTKDAELKNFNCGKKLLSENLLNLKKFKCKENMGSEKSTSEKNAFIANLKKEMENSIVNGASGLSNTLLGNLQMLINQNTINDIESSDDENEYIEYIYNYRKYFLVSLCNLCKHDLCGQILIPCARCKMTFYCTTEHMKNDEAHRHFCHALQQVAETSGRHILYKCGLFTKEQFRSYRIVTIRKVESIMNRSLTAWEQEILLFPRLCNDICCREYRFDKLVDCPRCGQVAFCKNKPEHLSRTHPFWCRSFQLFKELIMFQERFGRMEPTLPMKILKDLPANCCSTSEILNQLNFDKQDACQYAALTQISTGPLTAWYTLKLCGKLKNNEIITVHLIGAEFEFEVHVLHKWELFFLHLTPTLKELNIIFIGPELNPKNIPFEKTKCCRLCCKNSRNVRYYFQNQIYHDYCAAGTFLEPNLICFFNAGLYRSTGFYMEDTWPKTILAASTLKCPIVVTSYTAYEAPLDLARFMQKSIRRLSIILPPILNPFTSEKPERNFISDDEAPLMFKNFYCFVVE